MLGEDLADDAYLLLQPGSLYPEKEDPGVGASRVIHKITEVFVDGQDETLILYGESEDVVIVHTGIDITYGEDVVALLAEARFHALANADIDQQIHT